MGKNFTLVSMHGMFCIFFNMDRFTYFVNGKILSITAHKETDKLQNRCVSLLIAIATVPVYHTL